MEKKSAILAMLLAISIFPAIASANYTASGQVLGQCDGAAVGGVTIFLTPANGTKYTNTSTAAGLWSWYLFTNGTVDVKLVKAGYFDTTTTLTVSGTTDQNFTIEDYCPTYTTGDVGKVSTDLAVGTASGTFNWVAIIGMGIVLAVCVYIYIRVKNPDKW